MATSADLHKSKHDMLFEEARRRQETQAQALTTTTAPHAECTFHPNILKTQLSVPAAHKRTSTTAVKRTESEDECTERFIPTSKQSQNANEKANAKTNAKAEREETKHAPFVPVVGRPPKTNRNSASLPIGDYLYSQMKVREDLRREHESQQTSKAKGEHQPSLVAEESRRLVANMKSLSYQKLFTILDADGDGLLTAKTVGIKGTLTVTHL